KVPEHPGHVRHARKHHAAIGDRIGEDEGLSVDNEIDVTERVEIEAGGRDDDVGFENPARPEEDTALQKPLDLISDNRGLAGADRLQEIAVGNKGDALPP